MTRIKIFIAIVLGICLAACSKKHTPVPHYTISKEFKTDTLTTVNVHIAARFNIAKLLLIAGKVKTDSAAIKNLAIHYLLPGNTDASAGENSYYASARFLTNNITTNDTLKDGNGNIVRLKIFGLDSAKASKLLSLQPNITIGKNILGRFIDDYNHTVIIPFKDPADKKGDVYIIEADSTGNVVSSTIPQRKTENGVEKWFVTSNGDYMTLKDSVLAQYPTNGLGLPYNSIKSGK